jgi:hypothetical protein
VGPFIFVGNVWLIRQLLPFNNQSAMIAESAKPSAMIAVQQPVGNDCRISQAVGNDCRISQTGGKNSPQPFNFNSTGEWISINNSRKTFVSLEIAFSKEV